MRPASPLRETGWLPDYVFVGDRLEAGLAFFANDSGRIARFSREPADLDGARRLDGQVVLPGLVNTHSQALRRLDRGMATLASDFSLSEEEIYDAARMAFLEMLLSGITDVGECGVLPVQPGESLGAILRAAVDVGIRITLFQSAVKTEQFTRDVDSLRAHVASDYPRDEIRLGAIIPGLQTMPLDELKDVAAHAHAKRYRLHLPLPSLADDITQFEATHGRTPVQFLSSAGLLDKRLTVIHRGTITPDDAQILGAARSLVCACPTRGSPTTRDKTGVDALWAAGVEMALGTHDQTRINLLEAARHLHDNGSAALRLHAATVAGARSLGSPGGALEVGRPADFFTVNLYDPSIAGASPKGLLDAIVNSSERRAIREVWVGALPRVVNGRHAHQGRIIRRFVELQQRRSR